MSQKFNAKMNISLSGTSFTDELHADVGASAFTLDHDFFINNVSSGDVLVIRTAASGGGTLLVQDTDYTITNQDLILSDADHANKNVYSDITITNAAYQSGNLYFSGKYVADVVDENDISQITWQYEAINSSQTLSPASYTAYGCTAGTNGIRLTLPTPTEYNKNLKLSFIKLDNTNSAVTLIGTINGLSYFFLIDQYQKVEIISTGSNWIVTQGTFIADTGWVNTNDWTNRHLGTANCVFDGKSGTFLIGEIIKEATSNNTGIIVAQDATTLYLWKVTGNGIWTNDRVITGQTSLATANVNNASTTKNADTNFYHGFAVTCAALRITTNICIANTFTEANIRGALDTAALALCLTAVDTNNFYILTGDSGTAIMQTSGAGYQVIDTEDYMYNVRAVLTI